MRLIGIILIIVLISAAFWLLNKGSNTTSDLPAIDQPSPSPENTLQEQNIEAAVVEIDSTINIEPSSPFSGPSIEVDESLYGDGPSTGAATDMELTAPEDSLPN